MAGTRKYCRHWKVLQVLEVLQVKYCRYWKVLLDKVLQVL